MGIRDDEKQIEELRKTNEELLFSCRELSDAKKQLDSVVNSLNAKETENNNILVELDRYKYEAGDYRNRYEAINASTFWRITKPARVMLDILRGNKKKSVDEVRKDSESDKKFKEQVEELTQGKKKNVLVVNHEFELTGAPVATFYFCKAIKKMGWNPIVVTPKDGAIGKKYRDEGIDYIVKEDVLWNPEIKDVTDCFEWILLVTLVTAATVNELKDEETPILWWIHEAQASYEVQDWIDRMPQHLPDNVSVYTGGEYARKKLLENKPMYRAENLLYPVPNIDEDDIIKYKRPDAFVGKKMFGIIGTLEDRKGYDKFVDAILTLSAEEVKKCVFYFVGRQCYEPAYEKVKYILKKYPENSVYIERLPLNELYGLYIELDCIVCASKDDPMPIVATEALQLGKLLICSENTGTAALVEKEAAGLIYKKNSVHQLADRMRQVINNNYDSKLVQNAKNVYLKNFTETIFEKNVKRAIENLRCKKEIQNLQRRKNVEECLGCIKDKKDIFNYDILKRFNYSDNRKIMLVSHEFSLTGAPIALQHLGTFLKEDGYDIVFVSPFDGPMRRELEKEGFPVIICEDMYTNAFLVELAQIFNTVVLSTVVTFRAVNILKNTFADVIWWIHDSEASYKVGGFANIMPETLPDNVRVYCGGEYAREKLLEYYPAYKNKCEVLYYYSPDVMERYSKDPVYKLPFEKKGRKLFAVMGQQDARKGHDVFVNAIRLLPEEERNKACFLFMGTRLDEQIGKAVDNLCSDYPENVYYIEQVDHRTLFSVYRQCDCIVCCSKDDPLPVFVTEAMMMKKTIICSENTGSAPIIKKAECGYVYYKDSAEELSQEIIKVLNEGNLLGMQNNARKAYEQNFSYQAFEDNVHRALAEGKTNNCNVNVSVIIPTYNATRAFEKTLSMLRNQKKIGYIEIVVVDSGSSDETLELCNKYDVKVINIPNSQFTHSYARNLGALNATGDVYAFLTQDACPENENWLINMVYPLIEGKVAAVSCIEKMPDGIDLFYRIASNDFNEYRGMQYEDKFNFLDKIDTADMIRKKASLSDVACVFDGKLFRKYMYRGVYAEDLDMGIRLINDGYGIALLKSVSVIHGHNRTKGYYLKRSYVEDIALRSMVQFPYEKYCLDRLAHGIVSFCEIISKINSIIHCAPGSTMNVDSFCNEYLKLLEMFKNGCGKFEHGNGCTYNDEMLEWLLVNLIPLTVDKERYDCLFLESMKYYVDHVIRSYYEYMGQTDIDEKETAWLKDAIEKQMAMHIGMFLARLEEFEPFKKDLKEKVKGI